MRSRGGVEAYCTHLTGSSKDGTEGLGLQGWVGVQAPDGGVGAVGGWARELLHGYLPLISLR